MPDDGLNLAAPKRRKRTWEEASDDEEADPEALEAVRIEAERDADRSGYAQHTQVPALVKKKRK